MPNHRVRMQVRKYFSLNKETYSQQDLKKMKKKEKKRMLTRNSGSNEGRAQKLVVLVVGFALLLIILWLGLSIQVNAHNIPRLQGLEYQADYASATSDESSVARGIDCHANQASVMSDECSFPWVEKTRLLMIPPIYYESGSVADIRTGLNFGPSKATILNASNLVFEPLNHHKHEHRSKASELIQSCLLCISFGKDVYSQLFLHDCSGLRLKYGGTGFPHFVVKQITREVKITPPFYGQNGSIEGLVTGLTFGCSVSPSFNACWDEISHYSNSEDPKAAESGYWKATGECCRIFTNSSTIVSRSTLEFYTGQAPNGMETYWIMQYYRTDQKGHSEIAKAKVKWADDCGILADSKRYRKVTRSTVSFQGLRGSYMVFLSRSSL